MSDPTIFIGSSSGEAIGLVLNYIKNTINDFKGTGEVMESIQELKSLSTVYYTTSQLHNIFIWFTNFLRFFCDSHYVGLSVYK
jgi:hypothetical protein